jgi:hypothetical protein
MICAAEMMQVIAYPPSGGVPAEMRAADARAPATTRRATTVSAVPERVEAAAVEATPPSAGRR